ncbi:acyl-CoA dehydrogenase family protein [Nocardia takedensis]|uniref:acyl-CoA dehydrogenase family protein n=1 Tax=Nocardia takedensis TaxID=259390 RepID=UPI003F77485F
MSTHSHDLSTDLPGPEATQRSSTVGCLRAAVVGDVELYRHVRAAVLAVGDQPPHGMTHAEEAAIGARLLPEVIAALGVDASTIATDAALRGTLCEVAAVAAPRLLSVLTGHFALATGAILAHGDGSPYQQAALAQLDSGAAIGVLALTELAGTNGRDHTVTATWDPRIDGFRLRTPSPAGAKFMPNVAGHATNIVVVTARLIIDGTDHGVLPFLLPPVTGTRDNEAIRIVALPEKIGAAMEHAMIDFHDLELPRHALLGGAWARVSADGEFETELSPGQRFQTAISTLDHGRLDLATAAVATARAALAGLFTYAGQRAPGAIPMLERDAVRADLATGLAAVYASTALGRLLRALPEDDPHRSLWSMLAKPLLSSTARQILLTCQARLGAQGTLRNNWIPDWVNNVLALSIAEGENQILSITGGRARATHTHLELPGTPAPLPEWITLLAEREAALVNAVRDGVPDPATRTLGPDGAAVEAATATAERAAATALLITAAGLADADARRMLETAATAYACDRITAHGHWYLAHGRLTTTQALDIAAELRRHHHDLLAELPVLIEGLSVPPLTGPVFSGDYLRSWTEYAQRAAT